MQAGSTCSVSSSSPLLLLSSAFFSLHSCALPLKLSNCPTNCRGGRSHRGGIGGEQVSFNSTARGWDVSVGTTPAGSMWRKAPIPRGPWAWKFYGASFEPVRFCGSQVFKEV